jgi:hypothetical protein
MQLVVPVLGLVVVMVGSARWLRPRMARWGATATEVARP